MNVSCIEFLDKCIKCKEYYNIDKNYLDEDKVCNDCNYKKELKLFKSLKDIGCKGFQRKICNIPECKACFSKTFISVENSKYWNYSLNKKGLKEITRGCNTEYYFKCPICIHDFLIMPNGVSAGRWCPYCVGRIDLCKDMDCIPCYEKSYASCEQAKYWDYDKNECNPRMIYKQTNFKHYHICNRCNHSINISPN